jgi:SAM-dependent methyltransferase
MFAGDEVFAYLECENCGTLQIKHIPDTMQKYYPKNYYSFSSQTSLKEKFIFFIRDFILFYFPLKLITKKINKKIPNLSLNALIKVTRNKKLKILDVGCGEGKFLKGLYQLGFRHISGIDPFMTSEQTKPFLMDKKELHSINQKYDIITFHHVFEHMEDTNKTLKKCYELLNPNGKIIIRVPVKDSFAYKKYGENWVQWDAPRHFQLLTKKAFFVLAKNNNFSIIDYYGDGYKLQFTGSEKYKRGFCYHSSNSIFTKKELAFFSDKSIELNQNGQSDQVVVVLEKH